MNEREATIYSYSFCYSKEEGGESVVGLSLNAMERMMMISWGKGWRY